VFVDFAGIERFPVAVLVPLGGILVLGVFGVGDGVEEELEAGGTAAVLGRTAVLALDISRIFGSGFAILERFERDDIPAKYQYRAPQRNLYNFRSLRMAAFGQLFFLTVWLKRGREAAVVAAEE